MEIRSRFENTSGEVLRGPLQSGGISVQPEDLCKRAFHVALGPYVLREFTVSHASVFIRMTLLCGTAQLRGAAPLFDHPGLKMIGSPSQPRRFLSLARTLKGSGRFVQFDDRPFARVSPRFQSGCCSLSRLRICFRTHLRLQNPDAFGCLRHSYAASRVFRKAQLERE